MLKLLDNFYITKIESNMRWSSSKLNRTSEYKFLYKDFWIELDVQFEILGYTAEANIAIVNFGYIIDVRKWSNRSQEYKWIDDLDKNSGKSTKQYFDNIDARKLVVRFIEKSIGKYLKNVGPAIVLRGAHNELKINLPRYHQLDKPFFDNGYYKKECDIKEFSSLYEITNSKKEDDAVMWVYSKNESYLSQLIEVFE